MVKLLLEHGADVGARADYGSTPLHGAALNGRVDAIKELVEAGADVGARTKGGWTPLHAAVSAAAFHSKFLGNEAVKWFVVLVKELVRAGADVGARTEDGRTPSDLTDKPEILAILNGEQ